MLALIPAHNEETTVASAIHSVQEQHQELRLVVVTDNCTDRTDEVARGAGAETFAPEGNQHKKAGALNQALAALLPNMDDDDFVFVMDADTVLNPDWMRTARAALDADPKAGAVGGIFLGDPDGGLLGQLQRNEYQRYRGDVLLRRNKAMVLTGTSSMFRVRVLREITAARGNILPGQAGQVYDIAALTEDNELTLATKTLGWTCVSPPECTVTTEVMLTWRALWVQRLRWQRGALENLRAYGWTRTTLPYIGQQFGLAVGTVAMTLFLIYAAIYLTYDAVHGGLPIRPSLIGTAIMGIFMMERLATLRGASWKARSIALPLVIELFYDIFIQATFVRSVIDTVRRTEAQWVSTN